MIDRDFCASSYLAFRYVVKSGVAWSKGFLPDLPRSALRTIKVAGADGVLGSLKDIVHKICAKNTTPGILISGGIDSAILAALMPRGTRAYTVRFAGSDAADESAAAGLCADKSGLRHSVVNIEWHDYLDNMDALMMRKRSPLHAVEIGLYKAAQAARQDGIGTLVAGIGADSTFGGLDKLLSQDWTFDSFIRRYTFVEPSSALKKPASTRAIFEKYRTGGKIDIQGFLKIVHGTGIIQAFNNAVEAAGCSPEYPYEHLSLNAPLDLARIRRGEPKYILREVFNVLYDDMPVPEKAAFARPMDEWMAFWRGPVRPEFRKGLDMKNFTGEQKWLLFCLERFLDMLEGAR